MVSNAHGVDSEKSATHLRVLLDTQVPNWKAIGIFLLKSFHSEFKSIKK